MNRFMFGFCATSLTAIFWPSLLPFAYVAPGVVLLLFILMRKAWVTSGVLLSIIWISSFVHLLMNYQTNSITNVINVRAEIISLVSQEHEWISADIRLVKPKLMFKPNQYLRIYWKAKHPVHSGQVYDFKLKPKSITNILNQGGFNQQKHFLSRHIIGRANVKQAKLVRNNTSIRNVLRDKLIAQLPKFDNGDLLLALLFGDKTKISSERWQQLRHSGTGHLISISGLHLSIVGGWTLLVLYFLFNRLLPSYGMRNFYFAVGLSLSCALGYAYLAGFSVPTQRAFIMLFTVLGLSVVKRFSSPWERLLLALFIVIAFDPLSVLSAGLWLSFIAITVILLSINAQMMNVNVFKETPLKVKLKQLVFIQCSISLVLGLVGCLLFGGASLHAVWVNIIVVPIFSVLIIPITLIAFVIWMLGLLLSSNWIFGFQIADFSLSHFSWLIAKVDGLPWSWLTPAQNIVLPVLFMLGGVMFFIIYRYSSRKWLSFFFIIPLGLQLYANNMHQRQWYLHMLDVGQGLALIIERNGRAIIYDTGARYGDFSYAKRTVIPFLQARGIVHVDKLIISHSDNDHSGGLSVLINKYPHAEVIFDYSDLKASMCTPRKERWEDLSLRYIWPTTPEDSNDGSCVVKIDDGNKSVLLTGDIERFAENEIVALKLNLESNVMLSPHHGSKTSSSDAFVNAVQPELVLIPAGYNNHWGFPKSEVVNRYKKFTKDIIVSGNSGQVTLVFNSNNIEINRYRTDIAPYWYNQLFKFAEFR